MIIQRDNSPEQNHDQERLQARSFVVETAALETEAILYQEFASAWAAKPLPRADAIIDKTFLETNVADQNSQLAADLAISHAQRRVMEELDEFSA